MPHIERISVAGKVIEVSRYYTYKYQAKGEKHRPRENITPESMEQNNQRVAARRLRLLMNENFRDGDLYLTFTFFKDIRPSTAKELQNIAATLARRLRSKYKKAGIEFKYIYCLELGPKGAAHIHMLIPEAPTKLVRACWDCGSFYCAPLYSDGEYKQLADYFIKYSDKTAEVDGTHVGKRWYPSTNLRKPKEHKRIVKSDLTRKVRNRAGYVELRASNKYGAKPGFYYVDKGLTQEGVNRFGYEYLSYTLHWYGGTAPPKWEEKEMSYDVGG